jgi:hypothetical protein
MAGKLNTESPFYLKLKIEAYLDDKYEIYLHIFGKRNHVMPFFFSYN